MAKLLLSHDDERMFQAWLEVEQARSAMAALPPSVVELLRRAWWSGIQSGTKRGLALAEREGEIMRLQHKRTEI